MDPAPSIVDVGYRSTHYWVVSAGRSRLLVDLGWPGTLGLMRSRLERMDVPLAEVRYGLATHYHPDHAGLAEELKRAGVPLLVLAPQVPAIGRLKDQVKPEDGYVEIRPEGNVEISFEESRSVLAEIGIAGEIVPTPGHSDDSVSLVLDDGSAFTGDLPLPGLGFGDDEALVQASWARLRALGATRAYPGHGPIHDLEGPAPH